MVKKDDLDELLYKYMPIADEELIRELEQQIDEEFEFSMDFEKRMEKLIRKNKFRSKISAFGKLFRYTAAILVVTWGLCVPFSQTVRAYSGMLIERIKTVLEDSFIYTYFVEDMGNGVEITLGGPAYVPEGYTCINSVEHDFIYFAVYENSLGEQIIYQQAIITDDMQVRLDSEYDSEKTTRLYEKELTIYFYEDGFKNLYYVFDKYEFIITADNVEEQELYRIVEETVKQFIQLE